MGRDIGPVRLSVGSGDAFFIKYDLSPSEQEMVALAIFKEISIKFESMQNSFPFYLATDSGFSEEDLPSDLIAFYMTVKGYSKGEIEKMCAIQNAASSREVWKATGGLGNNRRWKPFDHNNNCTCCPNALQWPSALDVIREAPRGTLWRGWGYPDTHYGDFVPPR
jgi:hypothetical protein